MTDRELLEKLGHVRVWTKRAGCVKRVYWQHRETGEVLPQSFLVLQERQRLRAEKEAKKS